MHRCLIVDWLTEVTLHESEDTTTALPNVCYIIETAIVVSEPRLVGMQHLSRRSSVIVAEAGAVFALVAVLLALVRCIILPAGGLFFGCFDVYMGFGNLLRYSGHFSSV